MISASLKYAIENALTAKFHISHSIIRSEPIGGGSINRAYKLETNRENFFIKWNDAKRFPGMFQSEAYGLDLLRSTNTISIPEVVAAGESAEESFLILEWIEPGKRNPLFFEDFGKKLAVLHRHTSKNFGLDRDNYIGSLHQSNKQHLSWIDFLINERLEPQVKLGVDQGKLANELISQLANLFKRLPDLVPQEKPALLHGDLWNGNFLVGSDGFVCLIDPAVYYGHREMDLAMTTLFGGFDSGFYQSYQEVFPLEKNFESRIGLYHLYPLLVHVNLFGGGYVQQVKSILSHY